MNYNMKQQNNTPYYRHFQEMLDDLLRRYGPQEAITCYSRRGEATVYTYNQLYADVTKLQSALIQNKLAAKPIAVAGENSYAWLVAYLGIIVSGGIAVCVDIEQPDDAVRMAVRQADCAAVILSASMLPVLHPPGEPYDLPTYLLDQEQPPWQSIWSLAKKAEPPLSSPVSLSPEQPAAVICTSGTTVRAKPVVLSHKAILTNVADALSMIDPPPKTFAALPMYHAYGMTCSALAGLVGGLGVCLNGNLKTMVRDLSVYQPGSTVVVPLIAENIHKMLWTEIEQAGLRKKLETMLRYYRLLGRPGFLKKRLQAAFCSKQLSNLSLLVCGGAYLSKEVADDLTDLGIQVIQGYGITECSPLVTVNRKPDSSSVGYPLPHVELSFSEEGEVLVRGDSLMSGYYRQPDLTRKAMENGWFKTGDLGRLTKDGRLVITGRKKNLIVFKNGKKISAEEIEDALAGIDLIKEVVAYGAVTGSSTDDVKLSIMVYPDPQKSRGMTSYEILDALQREIDQINAGLPSYKQIQMINLRDQEFEKTSSKKIKRPMI